MISAVATPDASERRRKLVPTAQSSTPQGESAPAALDMPGHVDPAQWHQSMGYARQVCARYFRDGATPADALMAFGLSSTGAAATDWTRAVTAIAHAFCAGPMRRTARKAA